MIDKNKVPHIYVEKLTKNKDNLGMLTDHSKAQKMKFYGKKPIINKMNIEKETIVLEEKKNNTFIFGEKKIISTLPFIKNAKI
jgi:hypothetical protein